MTRRKGEPRVLQRWNASVDQELCLGLVEELANRGQLDILAKVGALLSPPASAEAIKQHCAKMRQHREAEGLSVPPLQGRTASMRAKKAANPPPPRKRPSSLLPPTDDSNFEISEPLKKTPRTTIYTPAETPVLAPVRPVDDIPALVLPTSMHPSFAALQTTTNSDMPAEMTDFDDLLGAYDGPVQSQEIEHARQRSNVPDDTMWETAMQWANEQVHDQEVKLAAQLHLQADLAVGFCMDPSTHPDIPVQSLAPQNAGWYNQNNTVMADQATYLNVDDQHSLESTSYSRMFHPNIPDFTFPAHNNTVDSRIEEAEAELTQTLEGSIAPDTSSSDTQWLGHDDMAVDQDFVLLSQQAPDPYVPVFDVQASSVHSDTSWELIDPAEASTEDQSVVPSPLQPGNYTTSPAPHHDTSDNSTPALDLSDIVHNDIQEAYDQAMAEFRAHSWPTGIQSGNDSSVPRTW